MAKQNREHPYNRTATAGNAQPGQVNPSATTAGTEGTLQGEGEGGMRSAGATGPNPSTPANEGGGRTGDRTFRCADVGNADCRWEVTGRTEEELMPQIERHGREAHDIRNIDDQMRSKIQNAIRERRAA